jgi:hypothetical protein
VLGCVVPDGSFDTGSTFKKFLHWRRSEGVAIRYTEGPIPRTNDNERKEKIVNIIFYDSHEKRAIISKGYVTDTTVEIDLYPVFLMKNRDGWEVKDGPAGPGYWHSMEVFVESVSSQPLKLVMPNDAPDEPAACKSEYF